MKRILPLMKKNVLVITLLLSAAGFAQGIVIPEIVISDTYSRQGAYMCEYERAAIDINEFLSPFEMPAYFGGFAPAVPSYSAAQNVIGLPSNIRMITFSYNIGGSKPFAVAVYSMSGRQLVDTAPDDAEYAGFYRFRSARLDFGGKVKASVSGNDNRVSLKFPRGLYIAKTRIQDRTNAASLAMMNAVKTPSLLSRLRETY